MTKLTFPSQPLVETQGPRESVQAVLKQEDLPLDPDDIGEPMQEEESKHTTTAPLVNDARQSLSHVLTQADGLMIDGNVSSIKTSTVLDANVLSKVSKTPITSSGQSPTCVAEVLHLASAQSNVSVVCDDVRGLVIDLTGVESEPTETAGCDNQFMDDLDDEEFYTSFTDFDDDDHDDKDYQPSVEKEEEEKDSSDGSDVKEWEGEGVDYVKTVAEMAEEANTNDMFNPKVLGEYPECRLCGSDVMSVQQLSLN